MSAFAAQPDVGIPAGGRHGTYGERRLGAGDENTGSHFASDGQAHHVVAGGGDHRDQRAADAALAPAIREVGLRRTVGSASRRAPTPAGGPARGASQRPRRSGGGGVVLTRGGFLERRDRESAT